MEIPQVESNSITSRTRAVEEPTASYENPTKSVKAKGSKPTLKGRLLSYWLPEDFKDFRSFWDSQKDYVMRSIVVPNLKRVFVESLNGLLGTNISIRTPNSQSRIDRYSYDYSSSSNITRRPIGNQEPRQKEARFYEDLIFDTKDDADFHKDLITDEFDRNGGSLSVLKFMELAGQPTMHTQAGIGWRSLNGYSCRYSAADDGWVVSMPWPRDDVRQ